jgi:2'-5' RNA ligase
LKVGDAINESAIVIPVPQAEDLVRSWRVSLDPACVRGVPAHVTLLYPFAHPSAIDDDVLEALAQLFSDVEPFAFSFNSLAWFNESVLYLEPNPDTSFREMTSRLRDRFPDFPPYGGKILDPTPHLTIGDGAPLDVLKEAGKAVSIGLPLAVHSTEAWLMTGGVAPRSWTARNTFALGSVSSLTS